MLQRALIVALSLVWVPSAFANPILIPTNPQDILGSIIIGPGTPPAFVTFDVHLESALGATTAAVYDPDTPEFLGGTLVFDVDSAFPSSLLVLLASDLTQFASIQFDFASSQFDGPLWTVNAVGTPIGTVTDAALMGMTGPLTAHFSLLTQIQLAGATNNVFQLNAITATAPVPEPASLSLLGIGVAALAFRRRRRVL